MKRQHFFWLLGAIFTSSFIVAACTDDGSLLQPEAPAVSESATAAFPSSPLDATFPGTGMCMGNDAANNSSLVSGYPEGDATAFNCTSNDISLANARTTQGGPIQCVPGEMFNVDIVADIVETADSERTDIGIWIANDGGDAEDGSCDFFYFGAGDIGTDPATEPVNLDGDQCGDMNDGGTVTGFPLDQLTLTCPTDPVVIDGQTFIEIASCVSWTQPGGDRVCPVDGSDGPRAGTLPANKSKCNCDPFLVEVELVAQLTLKKNVTNDDGGTAKADEWTLNAGSLINEAGTCTDDGSVCAMALTSTATADPGTGYALSETGGPSDYTAGSWSCDGGSLVGSTITLAAGDDVTCQITNDDIAPTLTLKKNVTNDDGGTAKANAWTLVAGSLINEAGACTDDGSVCSMALTTQTAAQAGVGYALSETGGPSGYNAGSWSCDGGSLVGSTVTLALNEDVTCQITNDDAPAMLTLKKNVTNDDGGTAKANAWTLVAGSLINEAGACTDDGSVCSMALTTKTTAQANVGYALSETGGPSGYTAGSWSCDGGSLVGSTITLALSDDVTCQITNDDIAPTLTLKKNVTNDEGGTAKANQWTLVAGSLINEAGACTDDGSVCSMALTTQTTAQANLGYALSETGGPSGYTAGSWSCDGGSLVGSTITLGLNEDVTCQITNDDDPPVGEPGNSVNVRLLDIDLDFGDDLSGSFDVQNVSSNIATVTTVNVTAQFKASGGGGWTAVGVSGCTINPPLPDNIAVGGTNAYTFDCTLDSTVSGGTLRITVQVLLFGAPGKDNFKSTLTENI